MEIHLVERGDLQLAPGRRLHVMRHGTDACRIKVQAGYSVVALGHFGLFLDREGFTTFIKLHHTKAFRVIDIVTKDSGAAILLCVMHGGTQQLAKAVTIEDVVTQHHGAGIVPDEWLTQQKRLCQTIRTGLNFIG